ncbi:hypothetical protein FSP39_024298 [Pinctada imbricata]|uniref:SYO1-like TPR repeats domain-containing protein n=1 Tax=Pinctada imbricata TaxID=66713 RepID=A0AA88XK46_PINIB|nr:hypothetical protein FSP39_024298 [Pinctada imbricata]
MQLNSSSEDERECSCTTIANLVSQPSAVFTLLQHNIVKIVAPLMLDTSLQVRVKAIGALRNLSVEGGEDVCREMVRKDVLTPLVALFKQYGVNWVPEKLQSKRYANIKSDIFLEATHLLWNLCESSEEAMKVFSRENLFEVLWPCLQYNIYGMEVAVTVAQCIYTVSEDNIDVSKMFEKPEMIGSLESLLNQSPESSDMVLLQTLASGITVNVCSILDVADKESVKSKIVSTLSSTLAINALDILQSAANDVSQVGMNGDTQPEKSILEGQTENPVNRKVNELKNVLSAQQVALEITANLCCTSDEGWEDMDSSESSCDEVIEEVTMETESESQENQDMFTFLSMSDEMQAVIRKEEIFTKVLQKAQTAEICVECQKLKHLELIKSFERLQENALFCLNNLVFCLSDTLLGGLDGLHEIWQGLVQLSTTKQAVEKGSLLEAITSAMLSVVKKLADLQSPKLLSLNPIELQYLLEMGQHCQLPEVRTNAVRIVSTIGILFSKNPQPQPILKDIGLFLLEVACKDSETWVVAEALDCIFDVFCEDHLDVIDREIHLTERLKQLIPVFKSKLNAAKKNMGEHYPVISTARTNLIRFVKYKTSLHNT